MGITIVGQSGRLYHFDEPPWPSGIAAARGVYLIAGPHPWVRNALAPRDVWLYVGKAEDLHQRVVARLSNHHRIDDFVALGAHRLFVWYATGLLDDEGAAELDIKLALRPLLNDQPPGDTLGDTMRLGFAAI